VPSTARIATVLLMSLVVSAQQTQYSRSKQDDIEERSAIKSLHRPDKDVVLRGKNERPVGRYGVKTFRIERVPLSKPQSVGRGHKISDIHHLIVTGGPFNCDCTIWVDDMALPTWNVAGRELAVQFLGPVRLPQHAKIRVTEGGPCSNEQSGDSELPEELDLPGEMREKTVPPAVLRNVRSVRSSGDDGISVIVPVDEPLGIRNAGLVLQIGQREFNANANYLFAEAVIPKEVFWTLPDKANIIVKWNRCSKGGVARGKLDKSLLNQ
jgi:hypothetical protein